jgi:hypothetical protein
MIPVVAMSNLIAATEDFLGERGVSERKIRDFWQRIGDAVDVDDLLELIYLRWDATGLNEERLLDFLAYLEQEGVVNQQEVHS